MTWPSWFCDSCTAMSHDNASSRVCCSPSICNIDGLTVQYSNCGRGSQTSAPASEPRAHVFYTYLQPGLTLCTAHELIGSIHLSMTVAMQLQTGKQEMQQSMQQARTKHACQVSCAPKVSPCETPVVVACSCHRTRARPCLPFNTYIQQPIGAHSRCYGLKTSLRSGTLLAEALAERYQKHAKQSMRVSQTALPHAELHPRIILPQSPAVHS
jgi:hypothetical protein